MEDAPPFATALFWSKGGGAHGKTQQVDTSSPVQFSRILIVPSQNAN